MTFLLMVVTGAAIGLVASGFVAGGRTAGMTQTTLLSTFGYLFGAATGPLFHFGTLVQWVVGIALGSGLVTVYVVYRAIKERDEANAADACESEGGEAKPGSP